MILRPLTVAAFLAALGLGTGGAYADIVYFSGALSDNDDPVLSHFQAHVEWDYLNLDQLLMVTIYNATSTPYSYTLTELNFHTSGDISALTLVTDPVDPVYNGSFPGAVLVQDPPAQGGFGNFDEGLDFGLGHLGLLSGGSTTFYISVTGLAAASIDNNDFFGGAGSAAVHFQSGPQPTSDEDGVWGLAYGSSPPPITAVPEPASMLLLGLGLVGIGLHRTRGERM